jgi:hypothetical protein
MWEVDRALTENTRDMQLDKDRWRAEYTGFVKMAAEGATPTESERQLSRAMDVLLANIIRGGKGREQKSMAAVVSSLVLSDAITVVRNPAKATAQLKRDEQRAFTTTLEAPGEAASPERSKPRKQR